jgi:hypothetical protein
MSDDRRERAVPCTRCRRDTWNLIPVCNACIKRDQPRAPSGNTKPKEKK